MTEQRPGDLYRSHAHREQQIADETTSEDVRRIHGAAAIRWLSLADRTDRVGRIADPN